MEVKIEHIALWVKDLEKMKEFYTRYFGAVAGNKYINSQKKFESYFLSFNNGPRLELMYMPSVSSSEEDVNKQFTGYIHIAISVGRVEKVNALADRFRKDGFEIIDGPRRTGDGYYEVVILDPEMNRIEITI